MTPRYARSVSPAGVAALAALALFGTGCAGPPERAGCAEVEVGMLPWERGVPATPEHVCPGGGPGDPLIGTLTPDTVNSYPLDLEGASFLRFLAAQKEGDLILTLRGPAGEVVGEADGPNDRFIEQLSAVVENAGRYRLEMRLGEPREDGSPRPEAAVAYRVEVECLRPADLPRDRLRSRAEEKLARCIHLQALDTPEACREAIPHCVEARDLFRNLGDGILEAQTRNQLGRTHRCLGETDRALEHYRGALDVRASVEGFARGPDLLTAQASTFNNIALIYKDRGEVEAALAGYRQALELLRRAGTARDPVTTTRVLINLGSLHLDRGELACADACLRQALTISRDLGRRDLEALSLVHLGTLAHSTGRMGEARERFQRALDLIGATANPKLGTQILHNLGTVLDQLGRWQEALARYGQALELMRAQGFVKEQFYVHLNRGNLYRKLGEAREAVEDARRALELCGQIEDPACESNALLHLSAAYEALGDEGMLERARRDLENRLGDGAMGGRTRAYTHLQLGRILRQLGRRREALEEYETARRGMEEVPDRVGLALVLVNLGEARLELGEIAAARRLFRDALARSRETGQQSGEARCLLGLARAEQRAGGTEEAWRHAGRALDLIEGLRDGLRRDELRITYLASSLPYYETAIHLLVRRGRPERALEVAEKARARQLLESLGESWLPRRGESGGGGRRRLLHAGEIRRLLAGEDGTLLLVYFLGEEGSYLWAVDAGGVAVHPLPPRADIEALAGEAHRLLTARARRPGGERSEQRWRRLRRAREEYPRAAAALAAEVLGPVAHRLGAGGVRRLVVVATGGLQHIPFSALVAPRAPEGRYLVDDHEVSYLPSASVLPLLRERATRRPSDLRLPLALFADPVYCPPEVARRDPGACRFQRLPHAAEEAEAIFRLVPEPRRSAVLRRERHAASRRAVLEADLAPYRVLHFAVHGVLDLEQPARSALVLSQYDADGKPLADGSLALQDIYGLRLDADLVTLSACGTALGKEARGEGLIGLSRGFLYAGARRVVASLWSVEDERTMELMKDFYENMLAGGAAPAAALREAQRAVKANDPDPYDWASFILQGEYR